MLPLELREEILKLPETDNHSIAIVTGNWPRHKRFAYRVQKEFGKSVIAWYELDGSQKTRYTAYGRIKDQLSSTSKNRLFLRLLKKILSGVNFVQHDNSYEMSALITEKEFFKKEIEELETFSVIKPKKINPADVHSREFVDELRKINPYFLLTLGGPLYAKPLIEAARGIAINQHAGHSPVLKGNNTTDWALYHRQIKYVSSTVHMLTSGADAGPILRRSNPCIFPYDAYQTILPRVVALGTELMIEVVGDIIKDKRLIIFRQPREIGRTYLAKEFTDNIRNAILRDFNTGWLCKELSRLRQF